VGGIVRDLLLQAGPPVAMTDSAYLITALVGAGTALLIRIEGRVWDRVFPPIHALSVRLWAPVGAQKTLTVGLSPLTAVLLGMITAVGGGFSRDVVLRRIPGILGGNTLYATGAMAAAVTQVIFSLADHAQIGSIVATLVGMTLVLIARYRGWVLPPGAGWKPPRPQPPNLRRSARRPRRRRADCDRNLR